jgi:hypothetical protein
MHKKTLSFLIFVFVFGWSQLLAQSVFTPPIDPGYITHTWVFRENQTINSTIFNYTSPDYTGYISSIHSQCLNINKIEFSWRSSYLDARPSNWQNFGIPNCSSGSSSVSGTNPGTSNTSSNTSNGTTTNTSSTTTSTPPPPPPTTYYPPTSTTTNYTGSVTQTSNTFIRALKSVSGTVTFSDGKPVTDSYVGAYNSLTGLWIRTETNNSGYYVLNVYGGNWVIGVKPKSETVNWVPPQVKYEVNFSLDSVSELKTFNFSIPVSNSTLVVKAYDDSGSILKDVKIVVDSASISEITSGSRFSDGKNTDSYGQATFILKSGVYVIRAYIGNSQYINPKETIVTISPNDLINQNVVFQKTNVFSPNNLDFSGVTKLEDGQIVSEAFVSAWSEEGEYRSTRSGSLGGYNLILSRGSRWHISAKKVIGTLGYKSDEVFLKSENSSESLDLTLSKINIPLPKPAEVVSKISQDSTAKVSDGTTVTIPANTALSATGDSVNLSVSPTIEAPSQDNSQLVGVAYDISVKDTSGKSITKFSSKIEIILPYSKQELLDKGVTEDSLKPSYFDETNGVWVIIDDYIIDKNKSIIISKVDHLTRFAIVSPADITPPASPTSLSVSSAGNIMLSWVNPTSDFDHAKVYRSNEENKLGTVIDSEVSASNYLDNTTVSGLTYYYTVRSVDPAGNESINTNQVKAVGVGPGNSNSASNFTRPEPQGQTYKFLRNLKFGHKGDDVKKLQTILLSESVYPEGLITGYFGNLTKKAVIKFQEKYKDEILLPVGLSKGSGVVGSQTRKKLDTIDLNN